MASNWEHIFAYYDAIWRHDGNMRKPHAELTSGRCSDGFIDVLRVLSHTRLCMSAASELVTKLRDVYPGPVDWVVGADHAGATLSFAVAFLLDARHDFTEKDATGKLQQWKRMTIAPDKIVLQVEEMVTTATTLDRVRTGLAEGHPDYPLTYAPATLTLVNRSSYTAYHGEPLISALWTYFNEWEPNDCPLCQAGSPKLRPKANWHKFSGNP